MSQPPMLSLAFTISQRQGLEENFELTAQNANCPLLALPHALLCHTDDSLHLQHQDSVCALCADLGQHRPFLEA